MRPMTYAAAAACLCLAAACSSPKGGKVEMTDLDGYRWEEPIEIAVDNDDTLTRRDLSLVVRYDRRLAVDTLVVHIATHTPDSLSLVERLTLHIPPTEAVHPVERIFPSRSRAVLLHRGIYNITVTPQTDAAGIESVGLIIEESATDSDR